MTSKTQPLLLSTLNQPVKNNFIFLDRIKKICREVQWDLGIGTLLPSWKGLYQVKGLRDDLVAGLVVACAAVPLSLAIALASGVSPATVRAGKRVPSLNR